MSIFRKTVDATEIANKDERNTCLAEMQDSNVSTYKFTKKLYEEQYDFNMSIFRKTVDATEIANKDERNACLAEGIDLISHRNKIH